ncbi:MAG: sulfotransferase domain-containing protein [Bacillota bacterium]|nr:sulfotransferase domain-containing protein [Bacillota bacterium]
MDGGIVWLASYPKSGNTWFRSFIANLISEESIEITINNLPTDGIFSSRLIFDPLIGVESSNLTADEIDQLRPEAYNYLARKTNRKLFIKVHDAYTYLENGSPLLGTVNARAVYIMRNPLDVAVSYANHAARDIDHMIRVMGSESHALCDLPDRLPNQLRQKLLTWSHHVDSWMQARELPVHLLRYEDMSLDPLRTFTEAVRFIGLNSSEEEIIRALELSDFKVLKSQEEEHGFREKMFKSPSFFRSGKVGDWRNHLSDEQRDRLLSDHGIIMSKCGYLDPYGNIVY